jgi:nitrogen fixation NifU-like protein
MYSERLLDHFQNPRYVGELAPPAIVVDVQNPACGDMMRLSVRFEGDRVAEVAYKTRGCTASIATGSATVEWMMGRSRAELATVRAADLEALVGGLIPESKHAAVLCLDAIRAILLSIHGHSSIWS